MSIIEKQNKKAVKTALLIVQIQSVAKICFFYTVMNGGEKLLADFKIRLRQSINDGNRHGQNKKRQNSLILHYEKPAEPESILPDTPLKTIRPTFRGVRPADPSGSSARKRVP